MLFRTTSTTASRLPSNTTVAARSAHIGQDSRILPTSGYLRGSYPAGPRLMRLFGASGRMRSTVLTGFHIAIYESKWRRVLDGCTGRKLTSTSVFRCEWRFLPPFLYQQLDHLHPGGLSYGDSKHLTGDFRVGGGAVWYSVILAE